MRASTVQRKSVTLAALTTHARYIVVLIAPPSPLPLPPPPVERVSTTNLDYRDLGYVPPARGTMIVHAEEHRPYGKPLLANFVRENLPRIFAGKFRSGDPNLRQVNTDPEAGRFGAASTAPGQSHARVLYESFYQTDVDVKARHPDAFLSGGCAVTAATLIDNGLGDRRLLVGNVGTVKAVMAKTRTAAQLGGDFRAGADALRLTVLTTSDKAEGRAAEVDAARRGGRVDYNNLLNGRTMDVRSLGDGTNKPDDLSACAAGGRSLGSTYAPHLTVSSIEADDDFVIIGNAAFFEVCDPYDACDMVQRRIQSRGQGYYSEVANDLIARAVQKAETMYNGRHAVRRLRDVARFLLEWKRGKELTPVLFPTKQDFCVTVAWF